MKQELIILAANAGIDASEMTPERLKEAHDALIEDMPCLDQHDMRLQEALKQELQE